MTNKVIIINNKEPKSEPYQYPVCTFLVQLRCKFDAQFGWVDIHNTTPTHKLFN